MNLTPSQVKSQGLPANPRTALLKTIGVTPEVKDKTIMLDFNHPLAGKELTFDGSISLSQVSTYRDSTALVNGTETKVRNLKR